MHSPSSKVPPFDNLIERQVRRWDRIAAALRRHADLAEKADAHPRPVITISGSCGSGREQLAVELARELNYELYGRELVEKVAEDLGLNHPVVKGLDERVESEIRLILSTWIRGREIESNDYVRSLVRVMVGLARSGGAVILGRAGAFILEKLASQVALSVRVEAAMPQRIERIAANRQISEDEARAFIEDSDHHQAEFVRRYFRREVADPLAYDVVLNLGRLSIEQGRHVVMGAIASRGHDLKTLRAAG